jgi:5-enolpyruvylshikimate-3-phosphate synthase
MTPMKLFPEGFPERSRPASKSYQHRALICAALARGESAIAPVAASDDVRATASAVRRLGAECDLSPESIMKVRGISHPARAAEIDCGESGSTLRFMLPVALALGADCVFTGAAAWATGPMSRTGQSPRAGVLSTKRPAGRSVSGCARRVNCEAANSVCRAT